MKSGTSTVPGTQTRPRSLRARSTSMTCSARSFGSASRLLGQPHVLLLRRPARAGAGRRVDDGRAARDGDERLRRGADDVERPLPAGEAQQVHVRRRVGRPQHPVEVERLDVGLQLEPLGQHHLERVAGPDVLPDPLDALLRRRRGVQVARTSGASAVGPAPPRRAGTALVEIGGHRVEARRPRRRSRPYPRTPLAISSTVPSVWSSTARSVTSIIASSGMPRSSVLVSGSRSSRRTTS